MLMQIVFLFSLHILVSNAQDGKLSDGTSSNGNCKLAFEPVFNVGCNYSDPIVCVEAAKAVFFQCGKNTPTGISDPDDAPYCKNIDFGCGKNCQEFRTVTGMMRELLTINIIDFVFEIIQLLWIISGMNGIIFMGCGSWDEWDNAEHYKVIGLVVIAMIDIGLQIYAIILTNWVRDAIGTFTEAECVDLLDVHLLQHHDALKMLDNAAKTIVTLGVFELVIVILGTAMDFVVGCMMADDYYADETGKKYITNIAGIMQLCATIMAGVDLFVFTVPAQKTTERALGYFDGGFVADTLADTLNTVVSMERGSNALVNGFVQHQAPLSAGMGSWCVMPTNETVTCLSSL